MNPRIKDPVAAPAPAAGDAPTRPPRRLTRRRLLVGAAGLVTVGAAAGGVYWSSRRGVRIGLIGAGVRGSRLANVLRVARFLPLYGDILAIAEVDRPKAEALRAHECPRAEIYDDYARLLERDDLDAVIVAVPDHWHAKVAIDSVRAGKAVYCEKPLSHTIGEGQDMVDVVRRANTLFLVGTQQRSDANYRLACELVRNGRLGELQRVVVNVMEKGLLGGPFPAQPVPAGLDWDAWLGPAPVADYSPQRHENWRCFWDYSAGELVNWAVHDLDIAQWGLGAERSGPVEVDGYAPLGLPEVPGGYEVPRCFRVAFTYADGVQVILRSVKSDYVSSGRGRLGVLFEGSEGRVAVNRNGVYGQPVEDLTTDPLPEDAIRLHASTPARDRMVLAHLYHFLKCVVQGDPPVSDVESAHRTASLCQLAAISVRLGRKLEWDPTSQVFPHDAEAGAMIRGEARPPYVYRV